MLSQYLRVFKQSGSLPDGDDTNPADPLTDISLENQNQDGILVDFNYLYIAQHYPFMNLFMLMEIINDEVSKFKIEYWDGIEWQQAVDQLDNSQCLTRSGMLQFSRKNAHSWACVAETDSDSTGCPEATKGLYINDCYWLRLSFLDTVVFDVPNPLTEIKRICYAFTNTQHVNSIDIEAPSYYESIEDNKTDWNKEIIHASEEMVLDLKRSGFIKSAGQIIEMDETYLACAWKTLSHIYFQLGKAYNDNRAIVNDKYEKALSSKALSFDENMDGKLDRNEINATETRMVR